LATGLIVHLYDADSASIDSLLQLSQSIGWAHYSRADWERLIGLASQIRVCLDDGKVVGCGLRTLYTGHDSTAHITGSQQVSFIGMMLTAPEYRGGGIAPRILEALLDGAQRDNSVPILMATEMGEPVYLKRGFKKTALPGDRSPVVTKLAADLATVRSGMAATPQGWSWCGGKAAAADNADIRIAGIEDLETIVHLDAAETGLDRGALLGMLLNTPGSRAVIAMEEGSPVGYAIITVQPYNQMMMIGPMVVTKSSLALAMMQQVILNNDFPPCVTKVSTFILGGFNSTLCGEVRAYLEGWGFTPAMEAVAMDFSPQSATTSLSPPMRNYVCIAAPAWG